MRRTTHVSLLLLTSLVLASLTGCGSTTAATSDAPVGDSTAAPVGIAEAAESTTPEAEKPVELTVFAAASMTETLTELADTYMEQHPNVSLSFNFDSSGTLKTQIEEGADCDLFISAGQKQMDQLDRTAAADVNTDGLDFVEEGSRINLLENKVVLCVSDTSTLGITSFDSWAEAMKNNDQILFAMGNSDVPVGQYTQKILDYYGLDEEELASLGKITYGTNVKEVTTQISEAAVDAGVVYCTDAYSAGLTPLDDATQEMCGQVIYPAAVLNVSQHKEEAQSFLDYLTTDDSMAVFEAVGFSPAV